MSAEPEPDFAALEEQEQAVRGAFFSGYLAGWVDRYYQANDKAVDRYQEFQDRKASGADDDD